MPRQLTFGLTLALALAGCASEPERVAVSVPVVVPGAPTYVPMPAELVADCPGRPATLTGRVTGGDVLRAAKAWEAWAACVDARREALRALAEQAPGPAPFESK